MGEYDNYYKEIIRQSITTDREWPNFVSFNHKNKEIVCAIYFDRDNMYVIKDGLDFPFSELSENLKVLVCNEIECGRFKVEKSYQG